MSDTLSRLIDQPLSIEELIEKYLEKFNIDTSKIDDTNYYKGSYIDELASKIKNLKKVVC